ncbi:MAG: PBP1A family penicillin-binding protein [Hyphomicrobium sp.]
MAATGAKPTLVRRLLARLPWRVRLLVLMPLAAAGAAVIGVGGMMVYFTVTFPDPLVLRARERAPTVRILARDGQTMAERGGAHDFMPLDLLPPMVIDAVVATEDRRFNEHWGLDPAGLVRAAFANLRAGRFAQGGSTLTQQLAKNLFLTSERTMGRKLEELLLAFWLELRLSKSEILELYLNRVYFGGGAYGIEAAAQRFFDKSARELSIAEAAVIAGVLKAPSKYSPTASPASARVRGRAVLAKMRDAGVITAEQEKKSRAEIVQFSSARQTGHTPGADYVVDYVLERLPALIGASHSEVIVETTLDPELQRRANDIVRKELVLQGSVLAAEQAAVVVLDADGAIRAMVGGRSYAESQFNRATKARRQPGSTIKPFIYLAALEAGFTPETVAYDLPLSYQGWSPQNVSGRYAGAVTLRHALAQSINTVAVRLTLDLGPDRVAAVGRRLGIKSTLREEPSLALGTSEVSLLELTGAYAAFANGGRMIEPHAIRRVRMGSGRVLYARVAANDEPVIDSRHVGAMNDMLSEVLRSGSGKRAALADHPAAGKTGTSQDSRDAWFIGYTAHLTAGVWVGNDNGAIMNKTVRGGQLPADIWRQVMQSAHASKTPLALAGTAQRRAVMPVEVPLPAVAAPVASPRSRQVTATAAVPVAQKSPPHLARGEAEMLPWLIGDVSGSPASAIGPLPAATTSKPHPDERIGNEFITRALDGKGSSGAGPARNRPHAARAAYGRSRVPAAETPSRPSSSGELGPNGRIVVRPPPGMMSLGRPLSEFGAEIESQTGREADCGWWKHVTGC